MAEQEERDKLGDVAGWRCEHLLEFFTTVADRVVAEIGPKRVLHVGCASGFLVGALRVRGVDAFGIDISEHAIGEVRSHLQSYCRVASVVDSFGDQYDLVICIDVLENMVEEEVRHAIANICRSTCDVLFSALTHVDARPRSFWVERFAEQGFHLDVDFDASFIGPDAMRFRKRKVSSSLLDNLLDHRARLQSELAAFRLSAEEKDKLIADLNFRFLTIQRRFGWKLLECLRRVRDRLFPRDTRRRKAYWVLRRMAEVYLDEGLVACLRKTGYKFRQVWKRPNIGVKLLPQEFQGGLQQQHLNAQYQVWLQHHRLTPQDVARMKAAVESFTYTPLISILTPVYNTEQTWLEKAIQSVRTQIYPHWELCLVNDASTKPYVKSILDEYAAFDPRVRVRHLPENEGIAGASSHALSLAAGEFAGFLDHDDELSPGALFEVVKRLNEDPDLDLLYSDEDKIESDDSRVEPFFKPDWSPDLLLSMNYICHFSVFRRSRLEEIGGFRRGFDGSQDYDLVLRFTERTTRIGHIPKVLYHWRKTPGSAAAGPAAKPFAYKAGRRAIVDALRRRGCEGKVESILPGYYRVRYPLGGTPLVSIIVSVRDQCALLQQCLRSIQEKTSYTRYEIIVVDNETMEPKMLKYLDTVAGQWRVYRYPGQFNFSAINNFAATQARGDFLLFLDNETQGVHSDWLTAMLEHAQRPEVGAVGAKLVYPDGWIQHAGLLLGVGGLANHAFRYLPINSFGYCGLAEVVRNCSAVTGACMMVPRRVFEEVRGFDERFKAAYYDVDLCLRLRERGYLIVYTPLALLYYHESGTRERLRPTEEEELCWKLWGDLIRRGDPYYNPNLTVSRGDWSLRV